MLEKTPDILPFWHI